MLSLIITQVVVVLICKERVNLSKTSVYWRFCTNTRNRLRSCRKLPTEYFLGTYIAQHSSDDLDIVGSACIEVITSCFQELFILQILCMRHECNHIFSVSWCIDNIIVSITNLNDSSLSIWINMVLRASWIDNERNIKTGNSYSTWFYCYLLQYLSILYCVF